MTIYQTNSLPLPSEIFTQPCAERSKSFMVQSGREIIVEQLLKKNDIQLLEGDLLF